MELNIKLDIKFHVIIEEDGDSYHSYCPSFKGLHSCGKTEEEALRNAIDAACGYLQSIIKHGDPIPADIVAGKAITYSNRKPSKSAKTHVMEGEHHDFNNSQGDCFKVEE